MDSPTTQQWSHKVTIKHTAILRSSITFQILIINTYAHCDAYDFEKWTQVSLFNSNIVKCVNKEIKDIFLICISGPFSDISWNSMKYSPRLTWMNFVWPPTLIRPVYCNVLFQLHFNLYVILQGTLFFDDTKPGFSYRLLTWPPLLFVQSMFLGRSWHK